jgi:DNA-binding NarL/FixJ family response regulator
MRVLLVDYLPLAGCGVRALFEREADLEVCGEASSVEDGLRRLRDLEPDLVLVDLSAEVGNGLDLVQRIKDQYKTIKTLVSSVHDEASFAERALRAGASGYLSTQETTDQFVEAVRNVLRGKIHLSSTLTEHILYRTANGDNQQRPNVLHQLSTRELAVFELIGKGHTTRQVAGKLHLSIKTIETYREKIKAKLGLANGTQLIRHATQWVLASQSERSGHDENGNGHAAKYESRSSFPARRRPGKADLPIILQR